MSSPELLSCNPLWGRRAGGQPDTPCRGKKSACVYRRAGEGLICEVIPSGFSPDMHSPLFPERAFAISWTVYRLCVTRQPFADM
jgi:hypothetical protein